MNDLQMLHKAVGEPVTQGSIPLRAGGQEHRPRSRAWCNRLTPASSRRGSPACLPRAEKEPGFELASHGARVADLNGDLLPEKQRVKKR